MLANVDHVMQAPTVTASMPLNQLENVLMDSSAATGLTLVPHQVGTLEMLVYVQLDITVQVAILWLL